MRLKIAVFAGALALIPSLSLAMGCGGNHGQTAQMSCPVGQMIDAQTNECVPILDITS